jgi:hypothetical protein
VDWPILTGSEVFATVYDVGPAIDGILSDASNYYMLGYCPQQRCENSIPLSLKVARRDVKVHALGLRGK